VTLLEHVALLFTLREGAVDTLVQAIELSKAAPPCRLLCCAHRNVYCRLFDIDMLMWQIKHICAAVCAVQLAQSSAKHSGHRGQQGMPMIEAAQGSVTDPEILVTPSLSAHVSLELVVQDASSRAVTCKAATGQPLQPAGESGPVSQTAQGNTVAAAASSTVIPVQVH